MRFTNENNHKMENSVSNYNKKLNYICARHAGNSKKSRIMIHHYYIKDEKD
jgi:hypothetical protein